MAIDLRSVYPNYPANPLGNIDTSDPNYPFGKAKNESYDGAKDFFPVEKSWINEVLGFLAAILDIAGQTPDGTPESIAASQYLTILESRPVPLNRLTDGVGAIVDGSLVFGSSAEGTLQLTGTSAAESSLLSSSRLAKTLKEKIRISGGQIEYDNGIGTVHSMTSILYPITYGLVSSFAQGAGYRTRVSNAGIGITFSNVMFGAVYNLNLILIGWPPTVASYGMVSLPLNGVWQRDAPFLKLDQGYYDSFSQTDLALYNEAYLQFWIDPTLLM